MKDYRLYMWTEKSRLSNHRVNEDRYLFMEFAFMMDVKVRVMIVADGLGGLSDGDKAAHNAVMGFSRAFYEKMAELYMEKDVRTFSISCFADILMKIIKESMKTANEEVCKQAGTADTGTTCSVVCIVDHYAVAANVGDSPIYMYFAQSRELKMLSKLQTAAELDAASGRYERFSAEYYENSHLLYNSLGGHTVLDEEDISCSVVGRIQAGDMFLLGTDGAFGRMQEYEILEILDQCSKEEEGFIISQLFELARMDKDDDQTAILYIVCED